MSNPTVAAIMLVNGRHDMVKRAIRCFREQTYQNKHLLIYDTTPEETNFLDDVYEDGSVTVREAADLNHHGERKTVGYLRNRANHNAEFADIIVHLDSDDWSHPRRIEEQVALLQASGKQCVGYRDMLFHKTFTKSDPDALGADTWDSEGEAWLYTNTSRKYCLGTSLCYWRSAWEARPFPDAPKVAGESGEDTLWLREIDSLGIESTRRHATESEIRAHGLHPAPGVAVKDIGLMLEQEPRMIASIHGGNTSTQYQDVVGMQSSPSWRRVPEWDGHCWKMMAL